MGDRKQATSAAPATAPPFETLKRRLQIVRADNDLLFDQDGREYIDLSSANGATWLGHRHPRIQAAVARQLEQVWLTGGLETAIEHQAAEAVESFLPASHYLAGLYSTGMEAAEFALRFARAATQRSGAAGFARSMHGKSTATASLGWAPDEGALVPGVVRLPFVPDCREEDILSRLEATLAPRRTSAVFVEPIQASGGGHRGSPGFFQTVRNLCRRYETLLVFDEILTGFYRTGPPFAFTVLDDPPDVILLGKSLGNGFPVSAVAVHREYAVQPRMLPGSTFAANPLACAAVYATMESMREADLPDRVRAIEETIERALHPLREAGVAVRGSGALWILELPDSVDIRALVVRIFRRRVCVNFAGRILRVLPASSIRPHHLEQACRVLREEIIAATRNSAAAAR